MEGGLTVSPVPLNQGFNNNAGGFNNNVGFNNNAGGFNANVQVNSGGFGNYEGGGFTMTTQTNAMPYGNNQGFGSQNVNVNVNMNEGNYNESFEMGHVKGNSSGVFTTSSIDVSEKDSKNQPLVKHD